MNGAARLGLAGLLLATTTFVAGCCKKPSEAADAAEPEATEPAPPPSAATLVVVAPPELPAPPLAEGDLAPATSGPRVVTEFVAVDGVSLGTLPMGIGIPPGGPAYGGIALDGSGQRVDIGALIREKNALLLVFSRGGFCPYSNFELRELARNAAAFERRGVALAVVTADRPPEAEKTRLTYAAPFPVLSDGDLVLHDIYRVGHQAEAKELKSLALQQIEVEPWSNRKHHRFAVPSMFLVNRAGRVLWSHASEDERTRPKVSQILAALDARDLPPKLSASVSAAPLAKPPPPPDTVGTVQQRNP